MHTHRYSALHQILSLNYIFLGNQLPKARGGDYGSLNAELDFAGVAVLCCSDTELSSVLRSSEGFSNRKLCWGQFFPISAVIYKYPLPSPRRHADSEEFAFMVSSEIQMFITDVFIFFFSLVFFFFHSSNKVRPSWNTANACVSRRLSARPVSRSTNDYMLVKRVGSL